MRWTRWRQTSEEDHRAWTSSRYGPHGGGGRDCDRRERSGRATAGGAVRRPGRADLFRARAPTASRSSGRRPRLRPRRPRRTTSSLDFSSSPSSRSGHPDRRGARRQGGAHPRRLTGEKPRGRLDRRTCMTGTGAPSGMFWGMLVVLCPVPFLGAAIVPRWAWSGSLVEVASTMTSSTRAARRSPQHVGAVPADERCGGRPGGGTVRGHPDGVDRNEPVRRRRAEAAGGVRGGVSEPAGPPVHAARWPSEPGARVARSGLNESLLDPPSDYCLSSSRLGSHAYTWP